MYTYESVLHADRIGQRIENVIRDGAVELTIKKGVDGIWRYTAVVNLTAEQEAFIKSFRETHNQYEVLTADIEMFLHGHEAEHFSGYTQLADARNLWNEALNYAALAAALKETT